MKNGLYSDAAVGFFENIKSWQFALKIKGF